MTFTSIRLWPGIALPRAFETPSNGRATSRMTSLPSGWSAPSPKRLARPLPAPAVPALRREQRERFPPCLAATALMPRGEGPGASRQLVPPAARSCWLPSPECRPMDPEREPVFRVLQRLRRPSASPCCCSRQPAGGDQRPRRRRRPGEGRGCQRYAADRDSRGFRRSCRRRLRATAITGGRPNPVPPGPHPGAGRGRPGRTRRAGRGQDRRGHPQERRRRRRPRHQHPAGGIPGGDRDPRCAGRGRPRRAGQGLPRPGADRPGSSSSRSRLATAWR